MKLKEYLDKNGISITLFSVNTGISVPTLYRIMRGEWCSWRTATIIIKATEEKVGVEDLEVK